MIDAAVNGFVSGLFCGLGGGFSLMVVLWIFRVVRDALKGGDEDAR